VTRWLGASLLLLLLLVAACGGGGGPAASGSLPSPSALPSAAATPSPPATLAVAESRYGKIIVDVAGRALYLFDADRGAASSCYDACASAWPPLLAVQAPGAGPNLDQALVSTIARKDGSKQVAYNGHPLYYYLGDRSPGEIKCQAAVEYGGAWFVVSQRGEKITTP